MIELSIQSITPFLKSGQMFQDQLSGLDKMRQDAIMTMAGREDQCRMLAAGSLLQKALFKRGYRLAEMTVSKNEHGKPYIKALPDFHFNLSHSGEYAVCAVSDKPVGIDIERIRFQEEREWKRMDRLAKKIMTEEELAIYLETKKEKRPVEFTKLWTKKESASKLLGLGMQLPFEQIDTRSSGIFYELYQKEGYVLCVAAKQNQPCIWDKQMVTS